MQKKSDLLSMLEAKCPRCHTGSMFQHPLLKVSKFDKMNKVCPHCGFNYEPEPGFFYGAMYISYAISVGIFLVTGFILFNFFNDPPLWVYITTVPTIVLLLLPFTFRYSRVIYLYLFGGVSYNPKYEQINPNELT